MSREFGPAGNSVSRIMSKHLFSREDINIPGNPITQKEMLTGSKIVIDNKKIISYI
jgi:hypothetical protein